MTLLQELHSQRAATNDKYDSWDPWFALPYLQDPKNDPAFRLYFTPKWQAHVQLSLTNFLSLIFRATPFPKLLLLEKWHHARTQHFLRRYLAHQLRKLLVLRRQLDHANHTIAQLLDTTRDLVVHAQAISSSRRHVPAGLFEDDSAAVARLRSARDLGQRVIDIANRITGMEGSSRQLHQGMFFGHKADENTMLVDKLVKDVRLWLQLLRPECGSDSM